MGEGVDELAEPADLGLGAAPSEPWMPIAGTVVPSVMSSTAQGLPGRSVTARTSFHS